MLNKVLNRLAVVAGLEELENVEKVEVEEARGLSEENFKALTPTQQIRYIKDHPNSKYGKDPKWLRRAKMLKTKMSNVKKAKSVEDKKASKVIKAPKSDFITDKKTLDKLFGKKYTLNKDGSVDINGDIYLGYNHTKRNGNGFIVKFGKINGNFSCEEVYDLKSLKGAPKEVTGCFSVDDCKQLKSLKGAPEKVGG